MNPIDAAIASLESLDLGEKPNYAQVARKFGVDRSTLSKRHRGLQGSRTEQYENKRLLNDAQERELVEYITRLCERGLPPTKSMLRNFASQISQQEVGKSWPDRFLKRHKIEMVIKWTSGIDRNRHRADSAFKYSLYFELMKRKIEQYEIEPRHIYNMDEKGFLIGVLSKAKRIFSKRRFDEGGVRQFIQDGNREWITTIACICADGSALSPGLIYQATTGNIQDSWLQDFDPQLHKAFFASSPSGWTNNQLGLQWLKNIFDRETKGKARRAYRLLILDGHGSHINMSFIEYCDANKILLAIYPPHSTHTLQPLDVCLFKPLSTAYSTELTKYLTESQGITAITKRDFFRLFNQAWETTFKPKTILSGFEKCGLQPFNPDRVLERFNRNNDERPSSSESSRSVLKAEDWRRIEKLLKRVVINYRDPNTQKLSNTIHALSVQNLLLTDEITGLRKALQNEKKKRKRGKPLLLEPPPSYDGGAVFYSPNKVKEAREKQERKEAAADLARLQKQENIQRKVIEKAEKEQRIQQQRIERAIAREAREQAKAQKAAERKDTIHARQLDQQLKNDIKLLKQAEKVSTRKQPVTKLQKEADRGEEAPSAESRTGRAIRLPKRYLQ